MLLFSSVLALLLLGLTNASCSVSSAEAKADADDDATYQVNQEVLRIYWNIFYSQDGCMKALQHQVRIEFEASLQYILMAAHFDQVSDILLILSD